MSREGGGRVWEGGGRVREGGGRVREGGGLRYCISAQQRIQQYDMSAWHNGTSILTIRRIMLILLFQCLQFDTSCDLVLPLKEKVARDVFNIFSFLNQTYVVS